MLSELGIFILILFIVSLSLNWIWGSYFIQNGLNLFMSWITFNILIGLPYLDLLKVLLVFGFLRFESMSILIPRIPYLLIELGFKVMVIHKVYILCFTLQSFQQSIVFFPSLYGSLLWPIVFPSLIVWTLSC